MEAQLLKETLRKARMEERHSSPEVLENLRARSQVEFSRSTIKVETKFTTNKTFKPAGSLEQVNPSTTLNSKAIMMLM